MADMVAAARIRSTDTDTQSPAVIGTSVSREGSVCDPTPPSASWKSLPLGPTWDRWSAQPVSLASQSSAQRTSCTCYGFGQAAHPTSPCTSSTGATCRTSSGPQPHITFPERKPLTESVGNGTLVQEPERTSHNIQLLAVRPSHTSYRNGRTGLPSRSKQHNSIRCISEIGPESVAPRDVIAPAGTRMAPTSPELDPVSLILTRHPKLLHATRLVEQNEVGHAPSIAGESSRPWKGSDANPS